MAGEWRSSTWGEEISLEYGKALRGYDSANGEYRVFGSNGPVGWTTQPLTHGPGVILGRKGAYRGVEYSPNPFYVIDTAYYVMPKTNLDMRWLYYAIKHHKLGEIDDGSPIPSTTRSAVYVRGLEVPPLPEQRGIAHILGTLDDKIELNRKMNETLEAMAWALFQKMKGECSKRITVAEIAEINALTLGRNDELDWIEYIEISEVSRGDVAKVQVFRRDEEPSRARRRLRHGDTVLSTVRPERRAYFLCLHPSPNRIASTGFAVVTPVKAPWSFVHAALTQPEVFEQLGHMADGGAYPAIRPEIVGQWEIPWPNDGGVFEEFHRVCAPLYERTEYNRCESRTLTAIRDALLPKLMNGELLVHQ